MREIPCRYDVGTGLLKEGIETSTRRDDREQPQHLFTDIPDRFSDTSMGLLDPLGIIRQPRAQALQRTFCLLSAFYDPFGIKPQRDDEGINDRACHGIVSPGSIQ